MLAVIGHFISYIDLAKNKKVKEIEDKITILKFYTYISLTNKIEIQVVADNQTRWNSTYLILKRALKLRVRIDNFIREYSNNEEHHLSASNILSKED